MFAKGHGHNRKCNNCGKAIRVPGNDKLVWCSEDCFKEYFVWLKKLTVEEKRKVKDFLLNLDDYKGFDIGDVK